MKQSDFSLAYALAHFTYKFDTGEIREQKTGKLVGAPNSQDGGTRVTRNGKTVSGARLAWQLYTRKDVPVGGTITLRQRTPGHYGNRSNNLQSVDLK